MKEFSAVVRWERSGAAFTDNKYSRGHRWEFDGGVSVPASSSPLSVRLPFSIEAAVDPEEAFVASISSCHMLWFLYFAAAAGFVVEQYTDTAAGYMGIDERGKEAMLEVVLRPQITFDGTAPTRVQLDKIHHDAHESCYIANSVRCTVRVEPAGEPFQASFDKV